LYERYLLSWGGFSICLLRGPWYTPSVFCLLRQSRLLCWVPPWSNMDSSPSLSTITTHAHFHNNLVREDLFPFYRPTSRDNENPIDSFILINLNCGYEYVIVVFQSFFYLEKYINNIFLFFKNYFWDQHIKMIWKHQKHINLKKI
jgi:hypothetical protein